METTRNIGLSSMALWLYLEGGIDPVRGWADANGNVVDRESKQVEEGIETIDHEKKIDLSKLREVKIRNGWDGFSDKKYYGNIAIKTGSI